MEARDSAAGEPRTVPRLRLSWASAVLAGFLLALPAASPAGPPTERIRGAIDRVIGILKDPALAAEARREERRGMLRKEIEPVFDFAEMAKRSLGPEWRERTPAEREQFVAVFRELLENSYLGKIDSYQGEEIRYGKETLEGPYAEVKTLVVTRKGQEIPVNYRMLGNGETYRIYDVVIEGISLVSNYRSQFGGILRKSSFPQMMDRLRETVREQAK